MPGAGNPQAYDRYAYVFNNPVNGIDPTGHIACFDGEQCFNQGNIVAYFSSSASGLGVYSNIVNPSKTPPPSRRDRGGTSNGEMVYGGNRPTAIDNDTGPITNIILAFPFSEETYSNIGTGLDALAWFLDLYASGIVTYGGIVGAGIALPFALGGPEVPVVTGAAGAMIAELAIQPILNISNVLATMSLASTIVSDTKTGNTRIENMQFSASVQNSIILTSIGWLNKEAYTSLVFQTVSVGNDLKLWSLPRR